jgi:hypothetical protein
MKLIMENWRKFLREGDLVSDPRIIARLVINGSVDDAHKLMIQTGINPDLVIRPLIIKLMSDRESALEYEKSLNMSTPLGPGQPTLEGFYKINDKWRELYEDIYYFAKGEDPEWAPPVNWPYVSDKEYFVNLYKELSGSSEKQLAEGYLKDWSKHSTMNLGQVLRHLRYLTDLPDTPRLEALKRRLRWAANDLYYTLTPGQWHHTQDELDELSKYSYTELLRMGFDPDFADEMLGNLN